MSASADSAHRLPLGAPARAEVGRARQATLVELIDLDVVGKHLHWDVVGPLPHRAPGAGRDGRRLADAVAERSVAIGVAPNKLAAAVSVGRGLATLEAGTLTDGAVVQEVTNRLVEAAERVRGRRNRLGELDLGSQDVLVGSRANSRSSSG
ncbi:MAG TPA: hypothetical protein VGJ70_18785, partial [Solirubrobacteraceae bacterium]